MLVRAAEVQGSAMFVLEVCGSSIASEAVIETFFFCKVSSECFLNKRCDKRKVLLEFPFFCVSKQHQYLGFYVILI